MILDEIKITLNIATTDTTKDALLVLYTRKAVTLITFYLNMSTTIPPLDVSVAYPDAVIEYATICMNKRGSEGIKQSSQGSRSAVYEDSLPLSVKALLPLPFVKMMG